MKNVKNVKSDILLAKVLSNLDKVYGYTATMKRENKQIIHELVKRSVYAYYDNKITREEFKITFDYLYKLWRA